MQLNRFENTTIKSETAEFAFDRDVDVAVVGCGTAGTLAAISAARRGLSVLGIEPHTYTGGVGTGGIIQAYYFGSQGGAFEAIDDRVAELDSLYDEGVNGWHPDSKKMALQEALIDAGAEVLYRTVLSGVFVEEKRVVGVQVLTLDGFVNIKTRFAVDSTADGHLSAMAGCEFRYGRELDGKVQPFSFPRGRILKNNTIYHENFDAGYMNTTKADSMNRGIVESQSLHFFDKYEGEDRLPLVASHVGPRAGRFIIGEETVTFEDVIKDRQREQMTFQAWADFDTHSRDFAYESDLAQLWVTVCGHFKRTMQAEIPLGAFVPKGWDGLMVAGRCLSVDHDSGCMIRMMRDMQKVGEVVGEAISLAIRDNVKVMDIPFDELLTHLKASGCYPNEETRKYIKPWLDNVKDIKHGLSSPKYGDAMWSAYRKGDEMVPHLTQWLNTDDEWLRSNSALVLGMFGESASLRVLREIVAAHDDRVPESQGMRLPRYQAALFLIGRMEDADAVPLLIGELEKATEDFNWASHALMALIRIGHAHEHVRPRIIHAIDQFLNGSPNMATGLSGCVFVEIDRAPHLRWVVATQVASWCAEPSPI